MNLIYSYIKKVILIYMNLIFVNLLFVPAIKTKILENQKIFIFKLNSLQKLKKIDI